MANIKFYPHKGTGSSKVYLRLNIGREKDFRLSSGLTIENAKDWNHTTNLPKENTPKNKKLKNRLNDLSKELGKFIDDIEKDEAKGLFDIESKHIKSIIQKFNNLEPIKEKEFLVPYSKWFSNDLKRRTYIRNNVKLYYKQNTVDKYLNFSKILEKYQKHKGHKLKIKEVNTRFAADFLDYLTDIEKKSINTKGRYIKRLKTIVRDSQLNGCKVDPDYMNIKGFQDENIVTFLTFEEIDQIIKKEMPNERLQIAKDWFIISCYTAQRISDLHRFTKSNIQTIDGDKYIVLKQFKTGKNIEVPIHHIVRDILKKYGNDFPPKFTDNEQSQRSILSSLIKDVCRISGLRQKVQGRYNGKKGLYPKYKLISNHTGRRSFACNFYNLKDWSTQLIMNITGHVNERNFLTYIDKSDPTLSRIASAKFDAMEKEYLSKKEAQLKVVNE
ncbi:tyrosine-type recombinase/integrase [[Muricauda] lutisoli]|uniref:Tyrosine-type recombinase/integrase n=1 Tax=[Muricauda] lutisoli TaxID=2816035 RepID=A0ABS3EY28_9FLAO|nr:tyrosine-type recombinase/integrase [[Muricauda] lutisoli]MBO0331138.1 tyrosine-type recombinase/integrase [[Muricauda] lutisoli]